MYNNAQMYIYRHMYEYPVNRYKYMYTCNM